MTVILEAILAYLINLASGERSAAITASRERKLKEAVEQEDALKKALASTRSVRGEVRISRCESIRMSCHSIRNVIRIWHPKEALNEICRLLYRLKN